MISKEKTYIAKGICMLTVLVNHLCLECGVPSTVSLYTHNFCHIGMAGFLFLSGYGITKSFLDSGLNGYWEKKFIKIYLPAVLINAIYAIMLVEIFRTNYGRGLLFAEVLLLNNEPTINWYLWYLHLLFVWYLLFYIVAYFIKNTSGRIFAWIVVALMMWWIIPEVYGLANTYCLAFPVGVLYGETYKFILKKGNAKIKNIIELVCLIISISGFYVILHTNEVDCSFWGTKINFYIFTLFDNLIFMAGVACICFFSGWICNAWFGRFLRVLGEMSLMIYYLQEPLIVYPMRLVEDNKAKVLIMILGIVVVFALSYIYILRLKIISKVRIDLKQLNKNISQ